MTTTFLFTDMEGSTVRWVDHPEAMGECVARHDALLREAFTRHGGRVFTAAGDGFAVAFPDTRSAVAAAVDAQAALGAEDWSAVGGLSVRMGIHEGEAHERGGDYFGSDPALAARIMAVGHGGQILLSDVAARGADGRALIDLGEHRLKDFPDRRRLFQVAADASFPPLRTVDRIPSTLPAVGSALIGRAADLDRTRRLMAESRLVTLVGSGGVGKTRLAIEAASREQAYAPDGTYFIDLTKLAHPDDLPVFVGIGLSVALESGAQAATQLAAYLRDKRMRLVLDNCEHVLDAVAELAQAILAQSSDLRLLATSREPLDVEAERVVRVPPLTGEGDGDIPSPQVELFLSRLEDDDAVRRTDLRLVAEICERLDGIPLAIELAAARARVLSLDQLRDGLDDRFALLGGRARRRGRQRTLETTLDWSYALLDERERSWFRALSVFHAPFTLDAAAAVLELPTPDAVDAVDALVAKSLLNVWVDQGGDRRFRMLETMQAYGASKLADAGEAGRLRDLHLDYFAGKLPAQRILAWATRRNLDRIEADYADLVGAAQWAAERTDEPRLQALIGGLGLYWAGARLTPTGRRLCDGLLSQPLSSDFLGFLCFQRSFQAMVDLDTARWIEMGALAVTVEYEADPPPPWSVWARTVGGFYRVLVEPDSLARDLDEHVALARSTTDPDETEAFVRLLRAQAELLLGRLDVVADDLRVLEAWNESQDEPPIMMSDAALRTALSVAILSGDADCARNLADAEPLYPESFWASEHTVLRAIGRAVGDDIEGGAAMIVQCARRYGSIGLTGLDDLLMVGAAVVRSLDGHEERSVQVLDVTAAGRSPATQAIAERYYRSRLDGGGEDVAAFRLRRIDESWVAARASQRAAVLRDELAWLTRRAGDRLDDDS